MILPHKFTSLLPVTTCFQYSLFIFLSILICTSVTTAANKDVDTSVFRLPHHQQPLHQCGLYMAPSTLGGANLGMYAGRHYVRREEIQSEIAIPLLFRDWEGPSYFHPPFDSDKNVNDHHDGALWYRYIWSGWVANIESYNVYNTQHSKVVFVPGIGCTINSLLDMANIQSTHGSTYDTAGYPRHDVSAGAFSPYHNSRTTASTTIPAGAELLADYGEEWIPDLPRAQLTLHPVMDAAEDFLRDDYVPFVRDILQQKHNASTKVMEGVWNFTRNFPSDPDNIPPKIMTVLPHVEWKSVHQQYTQLETLERALLQARAIKAATNASYIPPSTPFYYTETTSLIRYFMRQERRRSIDWLQHHGYCCDHMRVGVSPIRHAGRGAFATRHLPRGTVVGFAPLIHVGTHGRDLYTVPYIKGKNGSLSYEKYDLILNYAFGHANSTVLLNPYGCMVNYINHASPPHTPNVRIVWPPHALEAFVPEWLQRDTEFLTHTVDKIGLSLEYIALGDIDEGDEILLDYGSDWKAAWDEHVQHWQPPKDAARYQHSSHWNETILRTQEELIKNPYPPNLHTVCVPSYSWNPTQQACHYLQRDSVVKNRVPCTVVERVPVTATTTTTTTSPLVVEEYQYTVQLHLLHKNDPVTVLHYPQTAIFVTDKIMSQDWHLPNTFRHPIMIPDDMFPESWKNLIISNNNTHDIHEDHHHHSKHGQGDPKDKKSDHDIGSNSDNNATQNESQGQPTGISS